MSKLDNTFIDDNGELTMRTNMLRGRRVSPPDKLSDQVIVENENGDKELARKTHTDLQIEDIPKLADTLDALATTDESLQEQIEENASNIKTESSNRQIQDRALDDKISAEKNERTSADEKTNQDIADVRSIITEEITRATDAEYEISSNMVAKGILGVALVSAIIDAQSDTVSLKTQSKSTTDGSITENTYALPVADTERHGIMTKEAYAQLQNLETRTGALEGASRRYPVHLGKETLTQAQYQAAFEVACGAAGQIPPDGATLVNLDNNHAITYFENANGANEHWIDRGIDTVAVATNLIAGIVKGTTQTAGKIFVELDGTMSVNGWDALLSDVSNHIADNVRHITASERAAWNAKQAALTAIQLLAVDSGATAAKIAQYDAYAAGKQDKLESGINIKTLNGQSMLGSGDLEMSMVVDWGNIRGVLSDQTDLKNALDAKQAAMTAGFGLKIENNQISLVNSLDCGATDGADTDALDCGYTE